MASNSLHERAAREAQLYDEQALERDRYEAALDHANNGPARLRRDQFIKAVAERFADRKCLEIGSEAWGSVFVKNRINPADLTCINISQTEIDRSIPIAAERGVDIKFLLMDAHKLDFADASFDLVYGTAILHHLEFATALKELARVTKPGGEILFVEPLLLNPLARFVRWMTPKARTPDEKPLAREELAIINRYFTAEHLYTELFHVGAAVISGKVMKNPVNWLTKSADALDRGLLKAAPWLGPYFRSVTVHGKRREE